MSKTIWIINQYASTPETAMGGRHYYLSQELSKKGYKVYVIAGSYSHLMREYKSFHGNYFIEQIQSNFYFVWVKLPSYKNAHSKKRIFNEFLFTWRLGNLKHVILDIPNVIIHSSPSLIPYLKVRGLVKYYNVPSVFEIRDPWPLTLIEIGGFSRIHPFIQFLQWIEDKAYSEVDFAFSNFFNGIEHMQNRGLDRKKFYWIPNGVSLVEMNSQKKIDEEIISKIPTNKFIIGYTGTIGVANALIYLIEAAILLREYQDKFHFVLVGDGKEKEMLMNKVRSSGVTNITFLNSIPKVQVQAMLSMFDVCYIGWLKHEMYKLGVAANKLPEYLYSGRPILHSFSGKGDFVSEANAGITVEAENANMIATAILKLYNMNYLERSKLGDNGRNFVLKNLDYSVIAEKIENILF